MDAVTTLLKLYPRLQHLTETESVNLVSHLRMSQPTTHDDLISAIAKYEFGTHVPTSIITHNYAPDNDVEMDFEL